MNLALSRMFLLVNENVKLSGLIQAYSSTYYDPHQLNFT